MRPQYLRLPARLEQLRIAHGDGSYPRLMQQLLKNELLILDDWGMQKVTASQRQDLMESALKNAKPIVLID